jgi:hypothetical protein
VELGFEKPGRPLNSTRAGLLNHQTSKSSVMSFWMKISLWVFRIRVSCTYTPCQDNIVLTGESA